MTSEQDSTRTTRECPIPDCDWSYEYDEDRYGDSLTADFNAERHYERKHAGKVRIQITLEREQLLCGRDPKEVRKQWMEKYEDDSLIDVAHVRTEVLREPDDHSEVDNPNAQ